MFLDLLRSTHGPTLLRVKGIVNILDHPGEPLVVHGVQHLFHPSTRLPAWPDEDRRTRIVFIGKNMDTRAVRDLFGAFAGAAAVDRPDRAALTANPLVPFGGAKSSGIGHQFGLAGLRDFMQPAAIYVPS